MIARALSVVLALALAGDPPEAPAAPDAAEPAEPAPPAPPAARYVAVMRPPTQDPLLDEASTRIRAELAASGIESLLIDCAGSTEAHTPCPGPDAEATIALKRDDGIVALEVRAVLPDGLELYRRVRVLDRDGGQDPAVLAVRAVELLRDLRLNAQRRAPTEPPRPAASAAGTKKIERRAPAGPSGPAVDPEEPKKISPPPPSAEEPRRRLPPPSRPRWWLSTGVGVLASPASTQPGIAPAVGARLAAGTVIGPRLATIVAVSGPFNSEFSTAANGRATLLQGLATLELRYLFASHVVHPFLATLIGVNYLNANVSSAIPSASGESQVPLLSTVWVPLFGAAGGVAYYLGERFSVGAEAEIFATAPDTLLEIDGTVVARAGAPSILLTADLSLMLP